MPGLLLLRFGSQFQSDLNKPVLPCPLDCKAVWLLFVVLVDAIEMGTVQPCIVLGEIIALLMGFILALELTEVLG